MPNYNTQLQSIKTDLQEVLQALQGKTSGNGEAAEYSENEIAIITRAISNYTNDKITNIGDYTFTNCYKLTTVSFPACTSIGSNAFADCDNLTTVSFPACTSIGSYAFTLCTKLTTASFPVCTSIDYYAFGDCTNLTTASFPVCTSIDDGAFAGCDNLTTVSFPVCTFIGFGAFSSCYKLTTASFPACTSIDDYAFINCNSLTTALFPACTTIGDLAFSRCSSLTTVSFPACTSIGSNAFTLCTKLTTALFPACTNISSYAFRYCGNLSSITLGASTVCTLSNSNAFASTPYTGYSGYFSGVPYIYVPASLVDAYKSATNWTYFSSYFSSIESLGGNLITFTIHDVESQIKDIEYQAEEGMTWGEWVESDYNTSNYFIYDSLLVMNTEGFLVTYNFQDVLKSEQIVPERVYSINYSTVPGRG